MHSQFSVPQLVLLLISTLIFNFSCQSNMIQAQSAGGPAFVKLKGNQGNDRFEPSGVVLIADTAWVVSDRDGWIVAYELDDLKKGQKAKPKAAIQVNIPGEGRTKWEGVEWDGKQGIYLLEAISRSVWHCPDLSKGCEGLSMHNTALIQGKLNDIYQTRLGNDLNYLMLEGLALDPQGQLYLGLRGYHSKTKGYHPSSLLISEQGSIVFALDQGLIIDSIAYGLSGVTIQKQDNMLVFWMTWSFENEADHSKKGVSGKLIKAVVDAQSLNQGLSEAKFELCQSFEYKPEGITVDQKQIIVVFDEDKDRKTKKKKDGQGFDLTKKQDYAWVQDLNQLNCQALQ